MHKWLPWLTLICLIIQAIVTPLAAWLATRERKRRADDKALRGRVEDIDDRVRVIETKLELFPKPEELRELGQKMERLSGRLDGAEDLIERNDRLTNVLNEYLLTRKTGP